MKLQLANQSLSFLLLASMLLPAAVFAQEKPPSDKPPENKTAAEQATEKRNVVEFGVRNSWGEVYGRPDLQLGPGGPALTGNPSLSPGCLGCGSPFEPLLSTSKYQEYRDLRNGFFIRKIDVLYDNLGHSKTYVSLQSQKSIYRDQSYLATFGEYGRFKIQFRYDEIPHVYTNTSRTLFSATAPGVWSFPSAIRSQLQASLPINLPSLVAGTGINSLQGVVSNSTFITPSILRKAGTGLISFDVTPELNLYGMFFRESEKGTRPIGLIMNSSPSASATSGFGVELPETISYYNNLGRVGGEFGKHQAAIQFAYVGSFLEENIPSMTWDNPFLFTQPAGPAGVSNPVTGRMTLYPSNQAQYLDFAGATNMSKYLRLLASVTPGWLRQDQRFLPYTTNQAITGCGGVVGASCTTTASLPAPTLDGRKNTLAMNYTLVTLPWKAVQLKAAYRHYDYNNDTPVRTFTPVEGDAALPVVAGEQNTPFGFNRKTLDLSGNLFFAKKSSVKLGYQAEWMDRQHRDVEHSLEHTFLGALDMEHGNNLLFRLSYRHQIRTPDQYFDDASSDPTTGAPVSCNSTSVAFTDDQRCSRRFDEAHRVRDRGDALLEYSPTDRVSFSAFAGTVQDDYNQSGGTNSAAPLNFLTGAQATTSPYFLYGILKDISYNWGFSGDFALTNQVSLFAEYSREHNYRRMISRNRTPAAVGQTIVTCAGCDTANNDWESTTPEKVDIWTGGADIYLGKKAFFTAYYSLSAVRSDTFSHFLGIDGVDPSTGLDCSNLAVTSPCQFKLVGTSAAVNYPGSVSRQHEVVGIFKYKLTENLMPKFEFRYSQFDNRDFQTTPMAQYQGCSSAAPPIPATPGCPILAVNNAFSPTPTLSPNGSIPFYPGFQVVDPSAARYLFLGVDQPSYRAYYISATLEIHF